MPRMIKRTPVAPPKPLPQRGKEEEPETTLCTVEEPETTLCTVEETPKEKYEPILGWCVNCNRLAAHSWVDKLCYRCHKEANGFEFDEETKRWVKIPQRKKK